MYGVSSMTAPLRRVAVRRPGPSLEKADPSDWHYGPDFDPASVGDNHDAFTRLLKESGAEILWMEDDDRGIADAVFTYDASLLTPQGAILMSPGKPARRGEQDLHRAFYQSNNIPILGEIRADGRGEAGDTLWLDDRTLAVGRGYRTNQAGIDQLHALVDPMGISLIAYDMPAYHGVEACLHLMSLISFVGTKTALVCVPLTPVALLERLQRMDVQIIEAPFDEFENSGTLSTNILATRPGHGIMIDGLPKTRTALEQSGIEISTFDGRALCIGCEGGPTCMTRPILRE